MDSSASANDPGPHHGLYAPPDYWQSLDSFPEQSTDIFQFPWDTPVFQDESHSQSQLRTQSNAYASHPQSSSQDALSAGMTATPQQHYTLPQYRIPAQFENPSPPYSIRQPQSQPSFPTFQFDQQPYYQTSQIAAQDAFSRPPSVSVSRMAHVPIAPTPIRNPIGGFNDNQSFQDDLQVCGFVCQMKATNSSSPILWELQVFLLNLLPHIIIPSILNISLLLHRILPLHCQILMIRSLITMSILFPFNRRLNNKGMSQYQVRGNSNSVIGPLIITTIQFRPNR